MSVLESIFMGLLQGLTEFLPVSSSGHLILAQKLFGIEVSLFFNVMLHVGTLFAVVVVFRKSIVDCLAHPIKNKKFRYLVVASIPTFALALVAKLFLPEVLDGLLLPVGFALTIVLLVVSKYLYKPRLRFENAGYLPVIVCGVVQGFAVLPGLSRSGSTISTLKLFGVESSDAGEFSFLLSIPVILASALVEGLSAIKTPVDIAWYTILIGIVVAFVSGYVAIKTVMKVLKSDHWLVFAIYLIIPLILSIILLVV